MALLDQHQLVFFVKMPGFVEIPAI